MGLARLFMIMLLTVIWDLCCPTWVFAQLQGAFRSSQGKYDIPHSEISEHQFQSFWRSRIYGESTSLETQSAEVAGLDIFSENRYKLIERIEARVFLRAKFESGRAQSFFGDIEPANAILVREAALKVTPLDPISLKVGVLDQDWLDTRMFLYSQSFPGARAQGAFDIFKNFHLGLASQYLIPTSQTLSARTMDREPSPHLVTHTVYGNYDLGVYFLRASYNTFDYSVLPSQVAFDSQITGNSSRFIGGPNNSAFEFDFKGWFADIEAGVQLHPRVEFVALYNIIKNTAAPETFNDGHVIGVGTKVDFEDHIVKLSYENFFAESDVVPSFYSSWVYGKTNKEGQGVDLSVQFKKHNFRVRTQFYQADVINFNGLQEDQKYFFLGVETGYDKI